MIKCVAGSNLLSKFPEHFVCASYVSFSLMWLFVLSLFSLLESEQLEGKPQVWFIFNSATQSLTSIFLAVLQVNICNLNKMRNTEKKFQGDGGRAWVCVKILILDKKQI